MVRNPTCSSRDVLPRTRLERIAGKVKVNDSEYWSLGPEVEALKGPIGMAVHVDRLDLSILGCQPLVV